MKGLPIALFWKYYIQKLISDNSHFTMTCEPNIDLCYKYFVLSKDFFFFFFKKYKLWNVLKVQNISFVNFH